MNTATLQPIPAAGVSRSDAYRLIGATGPDLEDLFQAAAQLRERRTGCIISYSRKVFIPSISTAAGSPHGHFLRPAEIRALIFESGRLPVERSTTYQIRRMFEREPEQPDALDLVESAGTRFGSYPSLISSDEFRYRKATQA